ncbi:MAG TPA: formate/nitrite transporter family protein, partial [Chloroflexota bacterium]|nr:formate/nitrite transporter family protein [Chloroflexota bacterium]
IRREGERELERASVALGWSGLAAGLSMGFSLFSTGAIRSMLPAAPWAPLVYNLGYTVGFLIVVLGRQQLFTENTLTPILPLLHRPGLSSLLNVLRLWAIVLATNLIGAGLFAFLLANSSAFDPAMVRAFHQLGLAVLTGSRQALFVRAIFAGWLIALMVWLLPIAGILRPLIIIILTYVVGIGGLSHIIAGSADALYAVASGDASWTRFLGTFFWPTLLGNCIGGVALVALLNFAQVAPDKKTPGKP